MFTGTCFVGSWSTAKGALGSYGLFFIGTVQSRDRQPGAPEAPCEIIGSGPFDLRIRRNGRAEGFVTVPAHGQCFQEEWDERFVPGTYSLGLGCHACLTNATFEVTAPPRIPVLPQLPAEGLAVEGSGEVRLYDLDGTMLARVRGFTLQHQWVPDGPPQLESRQGLRYRLDVPGHRLRLDPADAEDVARTNQQLKMPAPRYAGKPASGHWRWAVPSPDGSRLLAQWSGECEVPKAFFVNAQGRDPSPVVGTVYADAPESIGLGWAADGRAIVHLPRGACGRSHPTPGLYAVGEELTLLLRLPESASAQMWSAR